MRVYLALGDPATEAWLKNTLSSSIAWVDLMHADIALVSRLADAKAAVESGVPVRFVAGTLDAKGRDMVTKAKELGIRDVQAWPEGEEVSASRVLAFLAEALPEVPRVEIPRGPYRVKVVSTRQSGGTFFAWNLWHVLREQGFDARFVSVSSASPLASWLAPPYRDIVFGAAQADGGDVWVLDASDTTVPVEADAVIAVRDCDPAKAFSAPPGPDAWVVVNRVPVRVSLPADSVHLEIEDLGSLVYEAMTTGVPAAARYPAFAEALSGLWQAIWKGDRGFQAKVLAPDMETTVLVKDAIAHGPGVGKSADGFVFDDEALDDNEDGGFVLDD
ncbi:hypothetical protein [Alicyclobacillus macrosporangiidus]|uniref:Uncharacterized protein n=1 Tax=Alicyclobacillus macrosporangiidus TaxID=392015 RepID=A0A1I7LER9_9BACL|nr:hypothetical protein [Alicyclobacillus macrosporangiidus]SFV08170.1 hypothetical protein SAMN05421543_1426 [Alicyclobacillus macrosporangiidus]